MQSMSHSTEQENVPFLDDPLVELSATNPSVSNPHPWFNALKKVLPVYILTHIVFVFLTYLSTLFSLSNFSSNALRLNTLIFDWYRWDSGHFTSIATISYDQPYRTAFFPLYPILEAALSLVTHNPFISGLIISDVAGLAMLTVLYRLVLEDFDADRAFRTVLYLAIFPTAFFFAAAYNESLFLLLAILSFYYMRRGQWWLAGLVGFLASLTRSAGLFLLVPFAYEYLRQHDFQLKSMRLDMLAGGGIPLGIVAFGIYCYYRFHDFLAFSHAQATWHRNLHGPWHGIFDSFYVIILHRGVLSFDSIHNVIDLTTSLIMLALVVLSFVGPWKFPRHLLSYSLYGAAVYLFLIVFPADGTFPLQSLSRLVLELFPVFIVLAAIGKKEQFNLYYVVFSISILSFMLLQFLTGGWMV
jgi:Gpi18-like mannosyltransferase